MPQVLITMRQALAGATVLPMNPRSLSNMFKLQIPSGYGSLMLFNSLTMVYRFYPMYFDNV